MRDPRSASTFGWSEPTHLQLLSLFRDGEVLTQAEITDQLPINSKRQARRLIKKLEEAGIPLEKSRRGQKKEYGLPPEQWNTRLQLDLNEREALALLLAAWAATSGLGPAPLEEALREATSALAEGLPASVTTFEPSSLLDQLHFGEAASVEIDPEVFTDLIEALSNRRSVEIDYYSASSDRRYEGRQVDPWGLAVRGGAWLCVADDHRSGERRDFNVTRIEAVRPRYPESNGGDYQIPEDFDLEMYFLDRFESVEGDDVHEVRLLLEPEVVPYFRSKRYHRTQQIHEADSDLSSEDERVGRAIVSFEVAGLREIAAFVRSWGPKVKVLAPEDLAEKIAADAEDTAQLYG